MPTLRRGGREGNLAARPGRPEILLTSESPYGSRRLVVEYDGFTTAAYVYDQTAVIAAAGVALVEGGQLLAVIPGWSDMSRGMPGYSRECVGQTPFAWSLDDAMEGLGPRADRATA